MLDCFTTVTSLKDRVKDRVKDSFLLLGSSHNQTRCKGPIISTLGFASPFFSSRGETVGKE